MLVLKNCSLLDLNQEGPFQDIEITKTEEFDMFVQGTMKQEKLESSS